MTLQIELSQTQIQRIHDENVKTVREIENAARVGAVSSGAFVFFAAFDGTNNDMNDLAGDRFCTNVGQLWSQYQAQAGGMQNIDGGYYYGLGKRGQSTKETWLPDRVTEGVVKRATDAYDDFAQRASNWLQGQPAGAVTVVITAFSRGAASAAIFAQLLYKLGLVSPQPQRKVLIQPGRVRVSAGIMFDPVATGVEGNLAYPPNVGNLVIIKALNEYRYFFKAVDYSKQADLTTNLGLYGNHCDVGGGYDNGLAALSLEAATKFLQKSGLPIADVPESRQFIRNEIAVHSEEQDNHGNTIWDVYNKDGFSFGDERLFDHEIVIAPASSQGPSGNQTFVLFDGSSVSL